MINYNLKKFCPVINTENGETSADTYFIYRQEGNVIYADYDGGKIIKGHLLGVVHDDSSLEFVYHQINSEGKIRTGQCVSKPEILSDGRIRLHETWQWTSGDGSSGTSIIEEIK